MMNTLPLQAKFTLNPEVVYFENDGKVLVTFINDDNAIFSLEHAAKDAFMLAINDYTLGEVQETLNAIVSHDIDVPGSLQSLFTNLLEKQIFHNAN